MQKNKENKIQELINRLCPEGVEYRRLEEICKINIGSQLNKKLLLEVGEYPVINGGILPSGYWREYNKEKNVITISQGGASAGYVRYMEVPFWAGAHCYTIALSSNDVIYKYLYYFLKNEEKVLQESQHGAGIPALNRKVIYNLSIPVPPIEVQREIVQILDNFTLYSTDLKEGLDKELKLRKKQYEYYFEKIMKNSDYPKIQIGKIGQVKMCKRILKNQTNTKDGIPFYKIGTFGKKADAYISNELYDAYKEKYNHPRKGDILISCSGTIGRTVVYDGKPAYFQDSNIVWLEHDESIVLNRYLRFCYFLNAWDIPTGGTILRLYNDNILKTEIPVPSLEEQKRIVDILEKFESLTNDLSIGLPAEIEARQKQYEYYRDKLLNFKEMKKN